MVKQLKWVDKPNEVSQKEINKIEEVISLKLPFVYKETIKKNDGNTPLESLFSYFDNSIGTIFESGIGAFISLADQENGMVSFYRDPPEFFPKGLIAFAEVGNGDLICFDYRQDRDNLDPPIVYWNHEADIGKDVSFIAKNFEEFLGMLKKSED